MLNHKVFRESTTQLQLQLREVFCCVSIVSLLVSHVYSLQNIYNNGATLHLVQCTFVGTDEQAGIFGNNDIFCNPGFFLNRTTNAPPKCSSCSVGRFSSASYPTPTCGECTACPAGMYGTKAQATSLAGGCESCPEGKYLEAKVAGSRSPCQNCTKGRYGQFPGEVNSNCTDLCPPSLVKLCTAGTASVVS